ncbi:SHOCT domain-containing protein [Thalassotalea sp. SU-HH00458]|uniref:SHOCT domain-containing protein n=1 Tax=Thalassotalea sp. SU-HH00458 TaxID=3127657 RepID=UPI003101E7B6
MLGNVHAETAETTLKIAHTFSNQSNVLWHEISKNPLDNESYIVHDKLGNIHLVKDNNLHAEPIIHLKKYFSQLHSLNKIALHPSFKLQQAYGYLTLYTAHIEPIDSNKPTTRIQENNPLSHHEYEWVISEWQFDNEKLTSFVHTKNQPREVLRLPIFSASQTILQLRFNPFMKSWNENYGNLYIALSADANYPDSALYSGSILSINPEKFGFKSYSIPVRNPFINREDINNEIIATGLHSLLEIHWPKDGKQQLFVTQNTPKKFSVNTIKYGEDLRQNKSQSNTIHAPFPQQSNSIIYRGMKFAKYRNHIFYLTWDNHWKLIAINKEPPFEVSTVQVIDDNRLTKDSELALLTDEHDELLIVDKSSHVIFTINSSTPDHQNSDNTVDKTTARQKNMNFAWILLLPLFIVSLVIVRRKTKTNLPKAFLRKQFAKFDLDAKKKSVLLYKRHEKIVNTELKIADIARSEIFLNKNSLYNFTYEEPESRFTNKKEQMLNLAFATEKRDKMIDDKVRIIEMVITDKSSNIYPICLYLRKGNQRLTRGKYEETCKQLSDWCWLLSQTIFPELTEERIIVKPVVPNTSNHKKTNKNEAIAIPSSNESSKNRATPDVPKPLPITPTEQNKVEADNNVELRDISLINSLDKLGKLKQQGLLTEAEFNQAKAKVFNNLNKND